MIDYDGCKTYRVCEKLLRRTTTEVPTIGEGVVIFVFRGRISEHQNTTGGRNEE